MPKKQKEEATGKNAFNTNKDAEFATEFETKKKFNPGQKATGKNAFNTKKDLNK